MINFFKKLDIEIEKHQNIIIMGHKNPDLDCIGSAIGLYKIMEPKCYIFRTINPTNRSATKAYQHLENKVKFITQNNYKDKLTNALLIIIDLNKEKLLEYQPILKEVKDTVIIDHHIIGNEKINTQFEYINPQASSTVEIVAQYLKYKKIKTDKLISTIMLAGIEIDTNSYNLRTTKETFETSSFLMSLGADNILKQELLKENKDEYIKRTKQIDKSYMINNKIICKLDDKIYNPSYLATMSEDLLRFENVEASFTIGKVDKKTIGISARSLGTVDVEFYMRILGGGGHKTDAACQFNETDVKKVEKRLKEILKEVKQ